MLYAMLAACAALIFVLALAVPHAAEARRLARLFRAQQRSSGDTILNFSQLGMVSPELVPELCCPRQPSRKLIRRVYRGCASPMARRRLSADSGTTIR